MRKEYVFLVYRWVKSFQKSGSIFNQKIQSHLEKAKLDNESLTQHLQKLDLLNLKIKDLIDKKDILEEENYSLKSYLKDKNLEEDYQIFTRKLEHNFEFER